MITIELLKSWSPCTDGFRRFCELFPNGTDLFTAGEKLAEDGHSDWGLWLYEKSRAAKMFEDVTIKGYMNTGNMNTGDRNTGDRNTGDWNTGYRNTGDWNTGYRNTGDRNTGYRNTGDWNTGDWNTGDWNTGFFNTDTPKTVRVFGKEIDLEIWNNCDKPNFLYFDITYWVSESNMTDEDKKADPNFYVRGGQLRKKGYKEAFIESWNKTHEADRKKVFNLPGFNADIFFQISGIDVNQQQK